MAASEDVESIAAAPVALAVHWGVPGVAEGARLLPDSTPEIVAALHRLGARMSVPAYSQDQLAAAKGADWVLPILEVISGISIGAAGGLLADAIAGAGQDHGTRSVRLMIRVHRSDGDVEELRLEGSPSDVVDALRRLDEPKD